MPRFLAIIEPAAGNDAAYSPDLPGCVSTGQTPDEVKRNMAEAIALHLDGLRDDGLPIPEPSSSAEYITVPGPA